MSIVIGREPTDWEAKVKREFTPYFEEMARILQRHDLLVWMRLPLKEHKVYGKWSEEEIRRMGHFFEVCEDFKRHFLPKP